VNGAANDLVADVQVNGDMAVTGTLAMTGGNIVMTDFDITGISNLRGNSTQLLTIGASGAGGDNVQINSKDSWSIDGDGTFNSSGAMTLTNIFQGTEIDALGNGVYSTHFVGLPDPTDNSSSGDDTYFDARGLEHDYVGGTGTSTEVAITGDMSLTGELKAAGTNKIADKEDLGANAPVDDGNGTSLVTINNTLVTGSSIIIATLETVDATETDIIPLSVSNQAVGSFQVRLSAVLPVSGFWTDWRLNYIIVNP
jgi:hypothetical protein